HISATASDPFLAKSGVSTTDDAVDGSHSTASMCRRVVALRVNHLVGDHLESRECARAERSYDCDVGGVAPSCHQDPSDARVVVARIEGVPTIPKIDFEPGAEVHWRVVGGHADIAEIAGAVARWHVHAAAQRDREVGEVPAYAPLLGVRRRQDADHDVSGV